MRQPAGGQTRWRHPSGTRAGKTTISSDVTSGWRQAEQDQRPSQMDAGLHHGVLTFHTERGVVTNRLYILGHTLKHATLTCPTAVTRNGSPPALDTTSHMSDKCRINTLPFVYRMQPSIPTYRTYTQGCFPGRGKKEERKKYYIYIYI